jgi:phosphoglycerate kinase
MQYRDITPHIADWDVEYTTVFLRIDGNVPMNNGEITDDFRLQSARATLDALLARHARVILATHRGRPDGIDQHLSTKPIADWFAGHGYDIAHIFLTPNTSIEQYCYTATQTKSNIVLLDNLRFFAGEEARDQTFADQLAHMADYYINDAWGLAHRDNTSVTLLPETYGTKASIGLLIEKELYNLAPIKTDPEQPWLGFLSHYSPRYRAIRKPRSLRASSPKSR